MPRMTLAEYHAHQARVGEAGQKKAYRHVRVKSELKNNPLRDVPERELQDDIASYLRANDIYFVRSAFGRKATTEPGTPDFIVCRGTFIALEVKRQGELPTDEQTKHAQRIQQSGGKWACVHSLDEAIKALLLL